MRDQNWDDLRFVLAISRAQSFAGAARLLRVNQSTVARRLEACERQFGTRLFERSSGRLTATSAGTQLIVHAEDAERAANLAHAGITGSDQAAAGTVRITAVPWIVNYVLAPHAGALTRANPGLRLELVAERRDLQLTRREADLAIRLARPQTDARALARKIGTIHYAAYGPTGSDHEALPWIGYDEALIDLPHARWLQRQIKSDASGLAPITADDAEAVLLCVNSGAGKSLLPCGLADRKTGLERLPVEHGLPSREIWLLSHPDLRHLMRIKVATGWICNKVQDYLRPT